MNKKYMDFVPSKPVEKSAGRVVAKKPVEKKVAAKPVMKKTVAKQKPVREEVVLQEDVLLTGAETFSLKKEPVYGIVEDYRPKFVKTEVTKRPLSRGHFASSKSELAEAKAVKVAAKKIEKPVRPVEKPVEKSEVAKVVADKTKMKVPKSPFINQAKVTKRPLSKNIYECTVKPTEEVATGPVTIISKPEKESKVSLVVTIIITIILGAAAGTVAFLLLPK